MPVTTYSLREGRFSSQISNVIDGLFSSRLSPKDLAIRRSKTNDKTKGPKVWLPTYFEKKKLLKIRFELRILYKVID